jgi:methionyl-tRNA synthetase
MGQAFQDFGIHFDIYHRTSSELHRKTSQDFFLKLHENGAFTEQEEQQYYDEVAKQFLADRYIMGTCPSCGNPDATATNARSAAVRLSPKELIDPASTLSGAPVVEAHHGTGTCPWSAAAMGGLQWINTGMLDGQPHHDPKEWKPRCWASATVG